MLVKREDEEEECGKVEGVRWGGGCSLEVEKARTCLEGRVQGQGQAAQQIGVARSASVGIVPLIQRSSSCRSLSCIPPLAFLSLHRMPWGPSSQHHPAAGRTAAGGRSKASQERQHPSCLLQQQRQRRQQQRPHLRESQCLSTQLPCVGASGAMRVALTH